MNGNQLLRTHLLIALQKSTGHSFVHAESNLISNWLLWRKETVYKYFLLTFFTRHLYISHNAPYCPPPSQKKKQKTIGISTVFSFSRDGCNSRGGMKNKELQNSGGQIRCIMGGVQVANRHFAYWAEFLFLRHFTN